MTEPALPRSEDARDGPTTPLVALVGRAQNGDQQAWRAIVERYTQSVWSTARSHHLDPEEAAEVAQRTWLRCVEHLAELREPSRLPDWLVTTARRESLRVIADRAQASRTLQSETPATAGPAADVTAARVAGWSTKMLPIEQRARYRDEFAAELYELRNERRWRQMVYAVRLLARSVQLRRALGAAPVTPVRNRDW